MWGVPDGSAARYNTICRISKRLFPPFKQEGDMEAEAPRKRGGEDELEADRSDSWKRRAHAPVQC
ncbi:hypothetical protein TSOC_009023 [Tetrabaena socialis]|uniref:Uncharacterized protein n=1 Tax=Tetrabaena socialis TaxID=47790 RepID=A0A2J7ZX42_9CHLO|nr:hypothetical protein TSOC_009023 [Tetrabaena socialis]|eukprot:PNH04826.1 hypothetical protein TSOC_009023 [Tetrabaena socialis]